MNRKIILEITYNTELASKEGVWDSIVELDFVTALKEVKKNE